MTKEQQARLLKTLNQDEGFDLKVYEDSLGNLTVGRGHKVTSSDNLNLGDVITEEQAEALYKADVINAVNAAKGYTGETVWGTLSPNRQNVLTNMAYNMGGSTLNKFKEAKKGITSGDWEYAADEMLDSIWSGQVGRRSKKLAHRMEEDVWGNEIPWWKRTGWFLGDQWNKLRR
jgi:GH24 family phage-related lysozyme (muramidase)